MMRFRDPFTNPDLDPSTTRTDLQITSESEVNYVSYVSISAHRLFVTATYVFDL